MIYSKISNPIDIGYFQDKGCGMTMPWSWSRKGKHHQNSINKKLPTSWIAKSLSKPTNFRKKIPQRLQTNSKRINIHWTKTKQHLLPPSSRRLHLIHILLLQLSSSLHSWPERHNLVGLNAKQNTLRVPTVPDTIHRELIIGSYNF